MHTHIKDQYDILVAICKRRMAVTFLLFLNSMIILTVVAIELEYSFEITAAGWAGLGILCIICALCIVQFFEDLSTFGKLQDMKDKGMIMIEIKNPQDLYGFNEGSEFGLFKSTLFDALKDKRDIKKYRLEKVTSTGVIFGQLSEIVEYPFHMYYVSDSYKKQQQREHNRWLQERKEFKNKRPSLTRPSS